MRAGRRSPRIIGILVLALVCATGGAQETARWLSSAAEARPYSSVADRLSSLAGELAAERIPERLFLDRLMEGARKRAEPERLVAALEEDTARLLFAARALDGAESTTFPAAASFAALPFQWLCLTAAYEGRAGGSEPYRHRLEFGVEFIRYGEEGSALHLPVTFSRTWAEAGSDEYALSVLAGYSFGAD